jgi:hypothetical protein
LENMQNLAAVVNSSVHLKEDSRTKRIINRLSRE